VASRYDQWHHKRAVEGLPEWLRDRGIKLLGELADRKERAGLGHICRVVRMSDGSRIKVTIAGKIPIVEYNYARQVVATTVEEDEDLFYVDSGWLRRASDGIITDPTASGMTLETAGSAAATYAAVTALLEDDTRTQGIAFAPEYGGDEAGDSFAIDRDYTGIEDTMEGDAAAIMVKHNALYLVGRTTGLLRCLLKGKIGRRLGEEGISSVDLDLMTWVQDGGFGTLFAGGLHGIIYTDLGFRLIKWSGSDVECIPLKVPDALSGMVDLFAEQSHSLVRQALATYLLAYAEVDDSINTCTTTVTGAPSPYPSGWHFASSRAECIGTEYDLVPGTGFDTTIHKVAFEVTADDDGVESIVGTLSAEENGIYCKVGTPVVWIPTPPPPNNMARLTHSSGSPVIAPVAVYAFYNDADEITPLFVECTSHSGGSITTVLEDSIVNCCGECTATYDYVAHTGITVVSGVECDGYTDTGGGSVMSASEIEGTDQQAGGSTTAGAAVVTSGSVCFQSGAFGSGITSDLFHGVRTWLTDTWSGTDGVGSLAVVVPYTFVDAVFTVKTRSRQMDSTGSARLDSAGLSGGIDSGNGTVFTWTHVYGNVISGGGILNVPSFPGRAAQRQYRAYGSAHGVNASTDLDLVTANAFNDDPGDPTMPTTWLDQFISFAGPIEYVALLAQSWHGEGWMRLGPYEFSVAFGGLTEPGNDGVASEYTLQPIGIQ